jgi:hypothetical protein
MGRSKASEKVCVHDEMGGYSAPTPKNAARAKHAKPNGKRLYTMRIRMPLHFDVQCQRLHGTFGDANLILYKHSDL